MKGYPLTTEKSVRLMQSENKLTFIFDKKITKREIKKEVEEEFKVKIIKVTSTILPNNKKKVFLKLDESTPAMDIATQLGLM